MVTSAESWVRSIELIEDTVLVLQRAGIHSVDIAEALRDMADSLDRERRQG